MEKTLFEMSTPIEVASYRAKRLKSALAIDLCCGTGNDSIALAKECKKVISFDINPKAIEIAQKKAQEQKLKNIEFYCQNCFSVNLKELKPNIVFADPGRRKEGKRVKKLSETEPSTSKLIEFIRNANISDFCIEASSNMQIELFPNDCEKEFISINNNPNCVSLYFGNLKKSNYAVVVLPQQKILRANEITPLKDFLEKPLRYVFEINKSIIRARMQGNLLQEIRKKFPKVFAFKENLFTSNNKATSPFFANTFRLIGTAKKDQEIHKLLAMGKAGKIVIRGKFKDQTEQLELKQKLSKNLKGKRKLHVFYFGEEAIVLRNVNL